MGLAYHLPRIITTKFYRISASYVGCSIRFLARVYTGRDEIMPLVRGGRYMEKEAVL